MSRFYVFFYSRCHSRMGMKGGEQIISLDTNSLHSRTILHEILHALGLNNEQSRIDSNDFLIKHWENIERSITWFKSSRVFPVLDNTELISNTVLKITREFVIFLNCSRNINFRKKKFQLYLNKNH